MGLHEVPTRKPSAEEFAHDEEARNPIIPALFSTDRESLHSSIAAAEKALVEFVKAPPGTDPPLPVAAIATLLKAFKNPALLPTTDGRERFRKQFAITQLDIVLTQSKVPGAEGFIKNSLTGTPGRRELDESLVAGISDLNASILRTGRHKLLKEKTLEKLAIRFEKLSERLESLIHRPADWNEKKKLKAETKGALIQELELISSALVIALEFVPRKGTLISRIEDNLGHLKYKLENSYFGDARTSSLSLATQVRDAEEHLNPPKKVSTPRAKERTKNAKPPPSGFAKHRHYVFGKGSPRLPDLED